MVPWLAKYASAGPLSAADAFLGAPGPGRATNVDVKRAADRTVRANRVRVFVLSFT
jgi:hypothetical protein